MDFNPKKNLYRKLGAVVLLIALTLALLTGCDKSSPAVSADPNIGIWKATTVEMFGDEYDANEIFDGGIELEFMAGDKCEFRADGKKDTYKWMSQGNTLTVSSDGTDIISATIEDGVMVIGDFMETGMKIALKKEGATTDKPDASAEATLAHTGSSESDLDGYAGDVDSGTAEQGADAAPHFTSANLKSIYEELSNAYDDFSLKDLSYEEVRDEYFDGVDGELDYEEGVLAIYKWFATDNGEAYVQVSFQDYIGDGDKTAGGVGSYLP